MADDLRTAAIQAGEKAIDNYTETTHGYVHSTEDGHGMAEAVLTAIVLCPTVRERAIEVMAGPISDAVRDGEDYAAAAFDALARELAGDGQ